MVKIPAWPITGEEPNQLIKPILDPYVGHWCPVMELSWGIGIVPSGSTPQLILAIATASVLPSGVLRYDTGIRDFGTRLQLDINWKHGGPTPELIPDWELFATLNKSLRLPVLRYRYTGGFFGRGGTPDPGRDSDWGISLVGVNLPACWSHNPVNVGLKASYPIPPLAMNEGYLLVDDCE